VPALERLRGLRVIADPAALDAARWSGDDVTVLRSAPDEAFGLGSHRVEIDDEHAIVADEAGFVGARCALGEVRDHIEWPLPPARPTLAQGSIAGVPARLWLTDDEALLVVHAAYADELAERLGWRS
jgi:hypothetical protein